MKRIITAGLLIVCIGTIGAIDLESYQFIDYLLSLPGPGAPHIYDDAVVFTAPSSYRRLGISFAYESYSRVYWFNKLLIPRDPAELGAVKKNKIDPNRDSGILFHVQVIPDGLKEMDYRLIIDGLWTVDPLNSRSITSPLGIQQSRVSVPSNPRPFSSYDAPPGSLAFSYNAPPGETITVAGSFNSWDPFMYEMREISPGSYNLTLALPPGTYQYVFFCRGERLLDPHNPAMVYTKEGRIASQAQIR